MRGRDHGDLPGRQRGVRAGRLYACTAAMVRPATRRCWCCDEVQAGFGRTGTLWGFEHSASCRTWHCSARASPVRCRWSAVAGRARRHGPARAGARPRRRIPAIRYAARRRWQPRSDHRREARRELRARRRRPAPNGYCALRGRFRHIGCWRGKGLVARLACAHPGTHEPDAALARDVVRRAVDKGLLMFAPVGPGGATIKICPPLCITSEAVEEGCDVLAACFEEAIEARRWERVMQPASDRGRRDDRARSVSAVALSAPAAGTPRRDRASARCARRRCESLAADPAIARAFPRARFWRGRAITARPSRRSRRVRSWSWPCPTSFITKW